jgi:predicted lipoprotein with Yx(FWY)xxD motif
VRAGLLALAHGPWSIVRRPDGTRQWAHDGRPLYTFAGEGPGQIRGETAGSGWKVVRLHRAFVPQDVSLWSDSKGQVLLVHKGRTLYLGELQGDTPSDRGADIFAESPPLDPARCTAGCRADWMPLTAPAGAAPAGDWSLVRSVTGEALWAYKGHVLYGYSGDLALGDRRGHARRIYLDETNAIFWRVATP